MIFALISARAIPPVLGDNRSMVGPEAVAAAGKRKRQLLPRAFRTDLAKLTRRYTHVFEGKPTLKDVAVRYFRALLQPHRRSGRACEQRITTASRLFKTYRKRYSTETYS